MDVILQNSIDFLSKYAEQSSKVEYIDEALGYIKIARDILKNDENNMFQNAKLIKVISQQEPLKKLKTDILRKNKIKELEK